MTEWEKAVRTEARWIRTRAAVVRIRNDALAGAGAEHPGEACASPVKPLSEHDRLRRVLLEMIGWKD